MRIGEFLVEEGLINPSQLKQALDAQLIYGGHLGTCLIELGFLDELRLGEVLAKTFQVPFASNARFQNIPRFVLAAVSDRLAEKHCAIPIELAEKVLGVALIDPGNLEAVAEIEFAAGCRVKPWIAPEARIFQALERYYNVARRTRFISLCNMLDRHNETPLELERISRLGEIIPSPTGLTAAPFSSGGTATAAPTAASTTTVDPLADVSKRMSLSEHRDQLAQVVLDHAVSDLERCVLFKVIRGSAQVWHSRGIRFPEGQAPSEVLSVVHDPIFGLLRGQDHYAGELGTAPGRVDFFARIGIAPPVELLLLPIYLNDELVAVFYGDGGVDGRVRVDVAVYRRLMRKLAVGLQIELLRRRLVNV